MNANKSHGSDASGQSPKNGNTMVKKLVAKLMQPPNYLNPSYTSFDQQQGARDQNVTVHLQEMNFRGMTVNAVYNKLVTPNVEVKKVAYLNQAQMPWNSVFMVTESDKSRLANPMQQSFVAQRQMTVPNAYGQFYAFMKALSAAFGTLQQ